MTDILSVAWHDADRSAVRINYPGGVYKIAPATLANRDYRRVVEGDPDAGDGPITIDPFQRWATIEAARAALKDDVEAHAAKLRRAAIGTNDPTKIAMYDQKYAIAVAALASDQSALDALASEAVARGVSPAQLAGVIKATGDGWRALGQAIEAASGGHKVAIDALADVAAAEAYDVAAGWPM